MIGLFRGLPAVLLLPALALVLGATGCDSYHYYDIDLQFDTTPGKFTVATVGEAQLCRVVVSGADSHEFDLIDCGLSTGIANTTDVGTFEFATFADSGTLTFSVSAYNGSPPTSACLFGMGTTSINASSTVTQTGKLVIEPDGTGCPNAGN